MNKEKKQRYIQLLSYKYFIKIDYNKTNSKKKKELQRKQLLKFKKIVIIIKKS